MNADWTCSTVSAWLSCLLRTHWLLVRAGLV
jgi:hypothetical protein